MRWEAEQAVRLNIPPSRPPQRQTKKAFPTLANGRWWKRNMHCQEMVAARSRSGSAWDVGPPFAKNTSLLGYTSNLRPKAIAKQLQFQVLWNEHKVPLTFPKIRLIAAWTVANAAHLVFPPLFGHRPIFFYMTEKKLNQFGHNAWKYRALHTVRRVWILPWDKRAKCLSDQNAPSKKMTQLFRQKKTSCTWICYTGTCFSRRTAGIREEAALSSWPR